MKTKILSLLLIIAFTFIFKLDLSATEQTPDVLIIGKDSFYLHSFPIEKLNFKENMNPFDTGFFVSTNCWRGYQAIWEIKDNKLLLQKIVKCNTDTEIDYNSVISYFEKNGYKPKLINGKIFAEWYSANLIKCENFQLSNKHLQEAAKIKKKQQVAFKFINGELILKI